MRYLLLSIVLLVGLGFLFPPSMLQGDEKLREAGLHNVDAAQALEIANEWKWSKQNIKSYVTTREVVLELASGKVIKAPLPKEKMVVAVAPYIHQTHQ
jgi:hypothetical protein